MRGIPGTSRDIYKNLKKNHEEVDEGVNSPVHVSKNKAPEGVKIDSMSMGDFGGGAFYSMQKRNKPDVKEVVEEVVVQKKKVDMSVDNLDYYLDIIRVSAKKQDYNMVLRALCNLYLMGNLDEYQIDGINKKEILALVDDLRDTIDRNLG